MSRAGAVLGFAALSIVVTMLAGDVPWLVAPLVGLPLVLRRYPRVAWSSAYIAALCVFVVLRRYAEPYGLAVRWEYVVLADTWLGLGELPTVRMQAWLAGNPLIDWPATWLYSSLFYVPAATAALLALSGRGLRQYVSALAIAYGIGVAVHWLLPTVPPWLAGRYGGPDTVQRLFVTTIYGTAPELIEAALGAAANPVAAMPSMHMAITCAACLAAWHAHRYLRPFAVAYFVAMAWCIVYLGEHYAVDAVAGAGVAYVSWRAAASWLAARRIAA